VVWLDAGDEELLRRLAADRTPRPLLDDPDPASRLRDLLASRRPLYAQADLTVLQAGGSPEAVALQVLEALPGVLREPTTTPPDPVRLVDGAGHHRPSVN